MEILAHRGLWGSPIERNTKKAFMKALESGYGIETDIRDCDGEIVISHDPPNKNTQDLLSLNDFLNLYSSKNYSNTLALNIKSDGLCNEIKFYLNKYQIQNYFVFDLSIPDLISYRDSKVNIFCRYSEFEDPSLLSLETNGLWLDSFSRKSYEEIDLNSLFNKWDSIAIVSPELHMFEKTDFWIRIKKDINNFSNKSISLCTDLPNEAKDFFAS